MSGNEVIETEIRAIESSFTAFTGGERCGLLDRKKLSEEQLTQEELIALMGRIKSLYKMVAADIRGKITTLATSSIQTATESSPSRMLAKYLIERDEELSELLRQFQEVTELYDDINSSLNELQRKLKQF